MGKCHDECQLNTGIFRTPQAATQNAREFLDGIVADYLEVVHVYWSH